MLKSKTRILVYVALVFLSGLLKAQVIDESISKAKPFPKRVSGSKESIDLKLNFTWTSPIENFQLDSSESEILVKAQIKSNGHLEASWVSLTVNEEVGSKADEVKLYGSNDQKEISFETALPLERLNRPVNNLVIRVEHPSGKRYQSEVLTLTVDELKRVGVVHHIDDQMGRGNSNTVDIFWIEPDLILLGDKPLVSKVHEIDVNLRIESQQTINRDMLTFVVNNIFVPLSPVATLRSRNNVYSISDRVTLREEIDINKIQLLIRYPQGQRVISEVLKVNFSANKPNLHVLSIGTKTNLNYTVKDAKDFASLFDNQGGLQGNRLFKKVQADLLTGHQATASEIKGTVEELLLKSETGMLQESDLLVLFISSHGFLDDISGEFRIQGDDFDSRRTRSTSVSYKNDILAILDLIPCKKMIFIDACHSGGGARASVTEVQKEIEKLNSKKKGISVIVSSQEDEESYEDVSWRNGAFTEAIISGLRDGRADTNSNGLVTIDELYKFISDQVPDMVASAKGKPQHPKMLNDELAKYSIYVIE